MQKKCKKCGHEKGELMFKMAKNTNPEMHDVCMICRRNMYRKKYKKARRKSV